MGLGPHVELLGRDLLQLLLPRFDPEHCDGYHGQSQGDGTEQGGARDGGDGDGRHDRRERSTTLRSWWPRRPGLSREIDPCGVHLSGVGHGGSCKGTDAPDRNDQQAIEERSVGRNLVSRDDETEESGRCEGGQQHDRLRAAPEPVQVGDDQVEGEPEQRRVTEDTAGVDLLEPQLLQVQRDPQLEARLHHPDPDAEQDDRHRETRERTGEELARSGP